jgi:hypothetical protein
MTDEVRQTMDENAKREFDALHALTEQAWRDWDHKTRHEWRLSFGLWAALLAASAAVLQTTFRPHPTAVVVGGLVVFVLHIVFLAWIQRRLREHRKEFLALRARMPAPATPAPSSGQDKCWCESPSVWTQTAITLLLIAIFAFVAMSEVPSGKQTPTKTGEKQSLTLATVDGPQA